jgi:hypothetical protein
MHLTEKLLSTLNDAGKLDRAQNILAKFDKTCSFLHLVY